MIKITLKSGKRMMIWAADVANIVEIEDKECLILLNDKTHLAVSETLNDLYNKFDRIRED